jgi:hypothetical protein
MRQKFVGLLALAAIILGAIFIVSPKATITTNAASTKLLGLDIWSITKAAKDLPEQNYAAH